MQLPIELVGGTNRNRSKRIAETKCINLIPERVSQGGRSTSAYHGAPGSILEHDFGASVRGLEFFGDRIYAVAGDSAYYIDEAATLTPVSVGTIPNDGKQVYIGSGNDVVAIGNETTTLYYISSLSLQTVSASHKTGGGCFLDGKFIFYKPDSNRWWSTESNSAITIDAADTTTCVSQSDYLKATHNHDQQLLLAGEKTIEVWSTATSGNPPFTKRVTIPVGLIASRSMASLVSGVCFLGHDRQVYQLNGYTPVPISTNEGSDIQHFLESATNTQIEGAFAFSYEQDGGEFYWLTVPGIGTFVYDASTRLWSQRSSGTEGAEHNATCYVSAWGQHYLGTSTGKLVRLDLDTYTEAGETIKQVRSFRINIPEGEFRTLDKIVLINDTGTILSTDDPLMGCRYSKDSGMSWAEKEPVSIGKQGDYRNETWFWQFGTARSFDIEIYNTNDCRISLAGAYCEVS